MATVTQLLDTASNFTGLRKTGSERALALEALNDVYMDACMWVQPVQEQYVHTFLESKDDYTVETHGDRDFTPTSVTALQVAVGSDPDTVALGQAPVISGTVIVQSDDLLTTYVLGVDYTLDDTAGTITTLAGQIPVGNIRVSYDYFSSSFPILRTDDIQLPPIIRLVTVSYDNGSNRYPLRHVSESELLEHRRSSSLTGFPRLYSLSGTGRIRVWPRPNPNNTLTINYVPLPPELSEGTDRPPALWDEAIWDLSVWGDARGAESVPSHIPIQFHRSVLLNGLVVQMLDKDQRSQSVAFWQQRYQDGLEKMHLWMAMYGGDPTTILDEEAISYGRYPDEWSRGF